MTDIQTITLKEPVVVTLKAAGADERTETISVLELHPFKARDLRAIDPFGDNHEGSKILALIARMTRQPVKVIDELGGADFTTLADRVSAFLPNGQKTGGTAQGT
jgi:hypothetical protein